jgi:hypothetical protein
MKKRSREKRDSKKSTEIAKAYDPTPEERAAKEAVRARRIKTPRVKVSGAALSLDHANPTLGKAQLMAVLGTGEVDFFWQILLQLGSVSVQEGKAHEGNLNFMVDVIKGIQPRDQLETMLAAQMAVVHLLAMNMAARLQQSSTLLQMDSTERAVNKFTRTFAQQLEALKRYRSTGEQTVRVEHISVNSGGQAIVGNVTHGGGSKKPETPS